MQLTIDIGDVIREDNKLLTDMVSDLSGPVAFICVRAYVCSVHVPVLGLGVEIV